MKSVQLTTKAVRASLQTQIHDLREAEVSVPDDWRAGIDPRALYPGECYYRAYRYATKLACRLPALEEIWLVHGEYAILGIGHAWVELPGDVLFDAVLQRFYRRDAYYEIELAKPWYKYRPAAAMVIAANMPVNPSGTISFGGWHTVLKLPPPDPKIPSAIEYHRAIELLASVGLHGTP